MIFPIPIYVDDASKAKKFFKFYRKDGLTVSLFVWHPDLSFLQNVLINFYPLFVAKERHGDAS